MDQSDNYIKVQKLIAGIAWDFVRMYKTDFDDTHNQAVVCWFKAMETFDPEKAQLTTWTNIQVRGRLLVWIRDQIENKPCPPTVRTHTWSNTLSDMLMDLSSDAKILLRLTVDTPPEIVSDMAHASTMYRKAAVKRYLKNNGWTGKQLEKSFTEIFNALV